jgi:hypothetical protein
MQEEGGIGFPLLCFLLEQNSASRFYWYVKQYFFLRVAVILFTCTSKKPPTEEIFLQGKRDIITFLPIFSFSLCTNAH